MSPFVGGRLLTCSCASASEAGPSGSVWLGGRRCRCRAARADRLVPEAGDVAQGRREVLGRLGPEEKNGSRAPRSNVRGGAWRSNCRHKPGQKVVRFEHESPVAVAPDFLQLELETAIGATSETLLGEWGDG